MSNDLIRDEDHTAEVHNSDFLSEEQIDNYFTGKFTTRINRATENIPDDIKPRVKEQADYFQKWYKRGAEHTSTYGHHEKVGGKFFDCNKLTDEWFKWWMTGPALTNDHDPDVKRDQRYQDKNALLMDKRDTFVYFAKALPFETPYVGRVLMTRRAPLLVPVYTVLASEQHSPSSSEEKLAKLVMEDLAEIDFLRFNATLDGEPIYGCCTVRQKPMDILNIPEYNVSGIPEDRLHDSNSTIRAWHGGYWLLIREKVLGPGDHLLKFQAISKNYEMEAKILIKVLA